MAIVITQGGGVPPSSGNVLLWTVYFGWDGAGQIAIMDFHFNVTSTSGTGCTMGELAAGLQSKLEVNGMRALLSTTTTLLGSKVATLNVAPYPLPGIATSTSTGSDTTDTLPGQVCGVMTKLTLASGRAFRGRVYFPFPPNSAQSVEGAPTSAYYLSMATVMANLYDGSPQTYTGAGGGTDLLPVLRQKLAPHNITNVVGVRPQPLWGTQRRRGDYGRRNMQVVG